MADRHLICNWLTEFMLDHSYWTEAEKEAERREAEAKARLCDHPGCVEAGLYRAPKSRAKPNEFHHFCLPHVQDYNKAWNYYQGLSMEQMDEVRRQDVIGWRPTWPLGKLGGAKGKDDLPSVDELRAKIFRDFFGGKGPRSQRRASATASPANDGLTPEERDSLHQFGLGLKASWYEIKARYRDLVKANHPDLHQEEVSVAEERLKLINRAYAVLKKKFQ